MTAVSCGGAPPVDPPALAPLSPSEIRVAAQIIRSRVPQSAHFSIMALDEPPKEMVLHRVAVARRAFAVLYDAEANRTWEAIANLATGRLDSLREVPNAQPMVTGEDSVRADRLVRRDPRWQRAMEARGIRDLNNVAIVAWTAGYFGLPGTDKGRVVRAIPYYAGGNTRNIYAHPIEGLVAHVNLTTGQVLEVLDTRSRRAGPASEGAELGPLFNTPLRLAPAPLAITQTQRAGLANREWRSALAEVALPLRAASARGPGAVHGGLRGWRTACVR